MATVPKGGSVSGGAGSLDARLDDITSEATLFTTMSLTLLAESAQVKKVVFDADFLESAPLSPTTFLNAEAAVTLAASDLLVRSGELGALALLLQGVVTTYTMTDAALAAAVEGVEYAVGFAIGLSAPGIVLSTAGMAAILAATYTAGTYLAELGSEAGSSVGSAWNSLAHEDPFMLMRNPSLGIALFGSTLASSFSFDEVLDDTRKDLEASLTWLMNDTGLVPGLVGVAVGITPGLLAGLTASTGTLAPALSTALSALSGGPWPPRTYEQTIDRLLRLSNNAGLLQQTDISVERRKSLKPSGATRPTNVGTLAQNLVLIDLASSTQEGSAQANITITQHNGNYVVMIPSTLDWNWKDTGNPADLTSNLEALSKQHQSELSFSVLAAMKLEGIPRGANVMFSGFSQGGITAAALTEQITRASDPLYNVTNVLTFGSPIATFTIPDSVNVLSFQHTGDFVPNLNGTTNPARANWTTVTSDIRSQPEFDLRDPLPSHSAVAYAATATAWDDASYTGRRAIVDFEESAKSYFDGGIASASEDTVHDYSAFRVPR